MGKQIFESFSFIPTNLMKDLYCRLPFEGYCIDAEGFGLPCCAFQKKDTHKLPIHENVSVDSDFFRSVQKEILSERIPDGCFHCYDRENQGMLSHRQKYIERRNKKNYKNDSTLKHLDISFSNTCNLACVMCSNRYSSKWNIINKKFPELTEITKSKPFESFNLSYAQIDDILEKSINLQSIVIKGGEPLLDKKCCYFLENLSKINPDLDVMIVSNVTAVDISILKPFKNLKIIASIDGLEDVYRWIRGFDFTTVDKNIDTLLNNNIQVIVNFTITAYNLHMLQKTHDYFIEKGIHHFGAYIAKEKYLHFNHLGKTKVEHYISNLNLSEFIYFPEYTEPSQKDKGDFAKFTKIMNLARGFEWQTIQL